MNKKNLIQAIRDFLKNELDVIVSSAKSAHAEATDPDNKAESKYDTRALEASYLAGAQASRASSLEAAIQTYQFIDLKKFNETTPVSATALVELAESGKKTLYFLAPLGGGFQVSCEGKTIFVIGPQAPLAIEMLGRKTGDIFELQLKNGVKEVEILSVQ